MAVALHPGKATPPLHPRPLFAIMVWRLDPSGRQLCDHHLRATPCRLCGDLGIHPELADASLEPLCVNCLARHKDIEWLEDKLMREARRGTGP